MILRWLRALRDRNWRVARALRRRCGRGVPVECRGRIQLTLAPDAQVHLGRPSTIGVPLLGPATALDTTTVLHLAAGSRLTLDGATLGRGVSLSIGPGAEVRLGPGTYVTDGSRIAASQSVLVGSGCAISWGVTIIDDDGHGFGPPPYSAPIEVGDRVWIGCNVTVLKGVTLGGGSVVAAGAVVTRSCPPRSLLAGVPARVIREDVEWTDSTRSQPSQVTPVRR
jgi:acetyltransferase-like isoleucine patch superfamily enzyme